MRRAPTCLPPSAPALAPRRCPADQAGVFLSRSSGMLWQASRRALWAMPLAQCGWLAFFLADALHHFWYNYWLLVPCFITGAQGRRGRAWGGRGGWHVAARQSAAPPIHTHPPILVQGCWAGRYTSTPSRSSQQRFRHSTGEQCRLPGEGRGLCGTRRRGGAPPQSWPAPPHRCREFSLGAASVADSLGVALADVAGILIQGCLFKLNGLPGADFAC